MVMGVLLMMLGLAVMVAQESVHIARTSTVDRNSKAALAAAQAGMQAARYRIAKLAPADQMCVTNTTVAPAADGNCPGFSESLGNGARYTYHATPALGPGDACSGSFVAGSIQRCITSTGTAHGASRRVQARVFASPGLLPLRGLLGTDGINIGNNSSVASNIGSNATISLGNNGSIHRAELGPSGMLAGNPSQTGPPIVNTVDFMLGVVPISGTETANNNVAIPAALGYNAANRTLTLNSGIVLPSGDYNFCRLDMGSGSLRAAPGATVRIFIDAPSSIRAASGCPNGVGWGTLHGKNGVSLGQPDGAPAALQFFIHGWPTSSAYAAQYGRSVVDVAKNNLDANALIYAPQTYVYVAKNNANINGAVAAEEIYIKNNLVFTWNNGLDSLVGGAYSRRDWRECLDRPSNPADPESGC